jgi:uncharacterized delta-60 repeat protein
MEENVQELLKDKNEDIVQFNFENNTSSPVAIDLFDTASLLTIPTSGNTTNTYSSSTDLIPSLPPSIFSFNPTNGLIISTDPTTEEIRLVDTINNTTPNNFDNTLGFDSAVTTLVIQPDGKMLVGGQFIFYKTFSNNRIIRLNSDGTKDLTFDNSIGFNGQLAGMVLQPDGKIICGGFFTTYKGVSENRIIRLNSDGTKDLTFDNSIGFDNGVDIIEIQPDGKILVGGAFTTYKGLAEVRIIRLNSDGTKDLTFDNSIGFTGGNVLEIKIQSDGKILVGGLFTTYKGLTENRIIRLNSDGSKDLTFDNSIGFGIGVVGLQKVLLQPDGKIVCGGSFTTYKGLTYRRIIRLNTDGSIDITFNPAFGYQGGSVNDISLLNDGSLIMVGFFDSFNNFLNARISKLDSNGNSQAILQTGNKNRDLAYCSSNNRFYLSPTTNYKANIISGNGDFLIGTPITLPTFDTRSYSIEYNVNNNNMYYLCKDIVLLNSFITIVDCSIDTIISTIPLPNYDISYALSNLTLLNTMYFFDNTTGFLQKIDCVSNTLVLINLSLPNITSNISSLNYNSTNGLLYIMTSNSGVIDVIDTNTDTYLTSITIPSTYSFQSNSSAINPLTNELFITDANVINPKQFAVINLNNNSLVSVNSMGGIGATYGVIYNSLTNSMYISGSLFSVVTFNATPFFIGGSTNYNTFVNNLNFEPVMIQEIRILTQNQTQLYNQVQFTKIDSNGNQIFFPEFPITKVDSFQAQGNIAGLKLNGLVFDGRTYINQYVINPSQIVSFEIIYKQLDRFSATPTFPIFFKPKIQLKEYIRKDYNNYDVEM